MIVETFTHSPSGEWNINAFPDLDSPKTVVFAFGGRGLRDDPEPLSQLGNAYPQAIKAGCSTSGEIFQTDVHDDSLVVAVAKFEETPMQSVSTRLDQMADSRSAGQQLGDGLEHDELTAVFVLSKGLEVNGSALARGLGESLPDDVVITGGLAGDGDRFERTWVYNGNSIDDQLVQVVGLYGDSLVVSHGADGGWEPFGPTRHVTRSDANVLYELDDDPALDIYKDYLGDQAAELPASALRFPLSVEPPASPNEQVVRTILSIDEDEQSMTFAGEIPEGSSARLMKTTIDKLIDGATEAADLTTLMTEHSEESDVLGQGVSCGGRRLVLKQLVGRELEGVLGELPASTHLIGFYSYGELSPSMPGRPCSLHNQTMTLTLFSEQS
jgi:hypothetical protein